MLVIVKGERLPVILKTGKKNFKSFEKKNKL